MNFEVSYIGDYEYNLPEGGYLAEKDADYVQACHALVTCASEKKPLKIWVRKGYHFSWLQKFCEQIHLSCYFSEKTARLVLADAWNVTVPEWLKDEDVVTLRLLDLNIKPDRSCRFEEALLDHFLGPAFRGDRLDWNRIAELVMVLSRQETKELFERYPLLSRCLQEQSQVWMIHADQNWEKTLLNFLISEPGQLWRDLSLWAIFSGYPAKLLEYVLPLPRAIFLRSIPMDLVKAFPLERKAIEEATTHIEMFFKDVGKDIASSDDFQKTVQCLSGRLIMEFKLVKNLLAAGRFVAGPEDIRVVREKFHHCSGLDAAELATLDFLMVPQRPVIPEKGAFNSPAEWTAWTVDTYISYRYWQTQTGSQDAELEEVVQSFSDWYVREYVAIHQDAEVSLVHVLSSFRDSLQSEGLSLIVLADGIPLTFWPMFPEALQKVGFYRHALAYRFAPLPTDTEFVKPSIFSGAWNPLQKSYEAILRERAANDWAGKRVVYLPNLKMLSDFSPPAEPTIIFLNLLAGDEILHGDMEAKGTTYAEELYRLFGRLGDMSAALLERWPGPRKAFGLYLLTDHGACRILEEEKRSFESKIISKLFADEKRRFAMIEKETADHIPENLWAMGYRFTQPFAKEEKVFFIPRGHNTVRAGRAEKGYTHGGPTPEEVIVPVAVFKAMKAAWKAPAARFVDLRMDPGTGKAVFYIQRVTSLRIEIINPNPEDIRIVRTAILKPDAEIKGEETPLISKGQTTTIGVACYFNKSSLGQEELIVQCVFEIAGEERVMEMKLAAEFKSALTGGFSLKDLK